MLRSKLDDRAAIGVRDGVVPYDECRQDRTQGRMAGLGPHSGDQASTRQYSGLRPEYIGRAISSGCIRMTNEDAIDLYNRVQIGAPVVVFPPGLGV